MGAMIDEVAAIRMQIMIVEGLLVGIALALAVPSPMFALLLSLYLIPCAPALLANLMEYSDTQA